MSTKELIRLRYKDITLDNNEQRLASWLEAGQDAPERLGVVWTPVKNEKADSFVEPLLPIGAVPDSFRVSQAELCLRAKASISSEVSMPVSTQVHYIMTFAAAPRVTEIFGKIDRTQDAIVLNCDIGQKRPSEKQMQLSCTKL